MYRYLGERDILNAVTLREGFPENTKKHQPGIHAMIMDRGGFLTAKKVLRLGLGGIDLSQIKSIDDLQNKMKQKK